jgi:hypothetical protein
MHKQSRRSVIVASFNIAIALTIEGSTDFADTLLASSFWKEFIPGFSFITNLKPQRHWTIREHANTEYNLKKCRITATIDATTSVIVIIEADFEKLRQAHGLYTLHGSYIGRKDMAIGFIGAVSGLGKTTLCAHATTQNWMWLGDEKFTVSTSGTIIGGVTSILNDAKTHAASAGLRPTPDTMQRSLHLLCIPLVTSESTATVYKLDLKRRQWQHYEEITRDIRQINGTLHGFSVPLPSLDTDALSQKRQHVASLWATSLPIVFIRGSKEAIVDKIETLLQSV